MDGQDWNTVVLKGAKSATKNGSSAGKVPNLTAAAAEQRRADAAEVPKRKALTSESRTQMMQLRAAMKKTQVELNQLCSFPVNTIRDIEAGRLTPNASQLIRLNAVLKTKMTLV